MVRDGEGLIAARRHAFGFHEPGLLEDERLALLDKVGARPTRDVAIKRGLQILKDMARIDARRDDASHAAGSGAGPAEVTDGH